jgi:hypothetical protein
LFQSELENKLKMHALAEAALKDEVQRMRSTQASLEAQAGGEHHPMVYQSHVLCRNLSHTMAMSSAAYLAYFADEGRSRGYWAPYFSSGRNRLCIQHLS